MAAQLCTAHEKSSTGRLERFYALFQIRLNQQPRVCLSCGKSSAEYKTKPQARVAYISTGASGFAPLGAEVKGADSPDVMYPRGE